jgi:branched-chain amino acid transport system substrate-binding protein
VRQINAQGGINGRPLKLVLADDRSTSAGAISAMQKLAGLHHIAAIIGPNYTTEILAMTPAIEQAGIPMIIGGQVAKTTQVGNPWVFRCRPSQIIESRVIATFAVSTLHLTRIAIAHTNLAGPGSDALLLGSLKRLGVVPVANETIPINSSDLTAQVLAIKKSGARALIVTLAQVSDYLLLARQMHQVGLHLTWVGNPILSVGTTVRQGGALLYGTYSATDSAPDRSPEAIAYNKELARQFHLTEPSSNAYVYDGVQILARVMRSVGTSPHAIRRGILALRGYRGVEGIYRFDRNGDGVHQEAIVQNVRGRLRVSKVVTV